MGVVWCIESIGEICDLSCLTEPITMVAGAIRERRVNRRDKAK